MRYFLTSIFCLLFFLTHAQTENVITEIIEENGDTLTSVKKIFAPNDKICEIIYFRKSKKVLKMSKEDMFIRGIKPYYSLDSVKIFAYDENWKLKPTQLLQDRDALAQFRSSTYPSKEFQLTENEIYFTGKTRSEREIHIGVQNLSPQDYYINIRKEGEVVPIREDLLIENRSTKSLIYTFKFSSRVNDFDLIIENSNGKQQNLKIQTVGFDLIQSDFVKKEDLKKRKVIEFEQNKDIFIDVVGNYKLLTVKGKKFKVQIPTSKLVNKLEGNLAAGKYILELQNLQTNEKRYCRVKIKVN